MADNSRDMMRSTRDRSLKRLVETSYHESEEPIYHLSSGKWSRFYIDCKIALSEAEWRAGMAALMVEKLNLDAIQAVGGLELGAYPIAIAISDAIYRLHGKDVRAFVVRKEPKTHGLQKYLEGEVNPSERVLIVDDVITSGTSTLSAIQKSQEAGLNIIQVLVIVDRQEDNGRANIEGKGIPFDALFTLPELSEVYRKLQLTYARP